MMTAQEIFDFVWTKLREQGRGSASEDGGTCFYRSSDGHLKCAIGHLIPDDLYKPEMEGISVRRILDRFPELNIILSEDLIYWNIDFLYHLQDAHDGASVTGGMFVECLREQMKSVAERFKLDTRILDDKP